MRRETVLAAVLLMVVLTFHSIPNVEAQSLYKVDDLSLLVTVLDDRSARVVMDYNFTWLQPSTYIRSWSLILDSDDAHGIRVGSQGRVLEFTAQSEGGITTLSVDLGREVHAGQSMHLRVEYVTSSCITVKGPERELSMNIFEGASLEAVNLTIVIPEGLTIVSSKPHFLQQPDWGGGHILTGVAQDIPPSSDLLITVIYAEPTTKYDVVYKYTFTNMGLTTERGVEFEVPLFAEAPRQTVTNLNCTPNPINSWYDDSGNFRGRFRFDEVLPGGTVEITVAYTVRVVIAPPAASTAGLGEVPEQYLVYTKGDRYWEVVDDSISQLAAELTAGEQSVFAMAKSIYDYTVENISYDYNKYYAVMSGVDVERYGAAKTLDLGKGVCEDITDLYVTLCRSAGIPAFEVIGFIYEGDGNVARGNRHAWAEVYLPDYGWLDVDPTWGLFGVLDGRHLGDRLFMNSSEPSYLQWNGRHFAYSVATTVLAEEDSSFYSPELSLTASAPGEAFTGSPFPMRFTLSNLGNGTAFSVNANITWSSNIDVEGGSFWFDRIWGYDYRDVSLVIKPNETGNATIWVHLEYNGEEGDQRESDYSFSFTVSKKPVYSIEGLLGGLGPYLWLFVGGGMSIAIMSCLAIWVSRRYNRQ